MLRHVWRHAPSVLGLLALASVICRAEDAAPSDTRELLKLGLDDLMKIRVTTVSREESTVGKSAAAVYVITQEDIRRSGATAIPELFRMVPGMSVASIDGNKWAVASRGFNNRFAKALQVQVDGRTVYAPLTGGVFWDTLDYPLADIERIEVIRGAGASLWGANAVNGIINIVTKSSKDTLGGYATAGGGNVVQSLGEFRLGGRLNDQTTYRVYGKASNSDKQFSSDGDSNDQWWRATGGMRLDWQPDKNNLVTIDGSYTRSAAGADDRFSLSSGPPYSRNIAEVETRDTEHILAQWSHKMDSGSNWTLQGYWDRYQLIGDSTYRDSRWNTFDVDFQYQFALGTRQKMMWGLGYRHISATLENSKPDSGYSLTWLENHPQSELFSGFLQDEIALVPDRLTMTLGSKLEHNSFTGWEGQPSGRLLWSPTKRQSVWTAVSRAVRTPSLTEDDVQLTLPSASSSAKSTTRLTANRDLQAEEVFAYEMGYRVQATEAFSVDTALFYNVYRDLRGNRTNTALAHTVQGILLGASQFQNNMSGETYGVELSANWRITDWWQLRGSYSYLQMNLHGDQSLSAASRTSSEKGIEGTTPQQQVYLQSSWNIGRNVELDLIGRFVDRLSGFNPSGITGVSDTVNDYVSLDARLAWRPRKNLEFAIVGKNLLDSRHAEFGTNPFVRSPLVEIKRSVYATVTITW